MKPLSKSSGQLIKQSIRNTASELLADLAEKKGFDPKKSTCEFMGSVDNQNVVRAAIMERFGQKDADEYEPAINVKPKTKWLQDGYVIKEGEIALCFIHTYRDGTQRTIALYHLLQMELSI